MSKIKIEDYMLMVLELCFKLNDDDLEILFYNIEEELEKRKKSREE